jgi:hypothetical protein
MQSRYPDKRAVPWSHELFWLPPSKPHESQSALGCVPLHSNGAKAHCRLQPHCSRKNLRLQASDTMSGTQFSLVWLKTTARWTQPHIQLSSASQGCIQPSGRPQINHTKSRTVYSSITVRDSHAIQSQQWWQQQQWRTTAA